MHEVEALIARFDKLNEGVRRFKSAVVHPLVQGFSLLPITEALASEVAGYQIEVRAARAKPLRNLLDGLQALAIDISHGTPVAYVKTYYLVGQGGQDALVWDKGNLIFSPATPGYDQAWPDTPISQALRSIGVVAEQGMDEFDTVGLGKHRQTHQWAESSK